MRRILDEIESISEPVPLLDPVTVRTGIDRVHLEIALALQLHGSFRRAAQALNMKTSTVNRRIRDLEFQLGCPIFERQKRRLVPTPSGQVFLRYSGEILASFHTLVEAVRRMADGKAGQITIGYYGPVSHRALHNLLFEADPAWPDVRRVPVELPHDRMKEALVTGRVDLAIFRGNPDEIPGKAAPLWTERLFVVLPEDHPLADLDLLRWPDLAEETFLVSGHHPSHAIRDLLLERLLAHADPRIIVHDVSAATIMHMVGAGLGIFLCLESALGNRYEGTVFREVFGVAGPEFVTCFAGWREDACNPALNRFIRTLLRRFPARPD